MSLKTLFTRYDKPIRINWISISESHKLHPINLYDVILDDYDFKIRKMDPKTRQFIKYI